jgi:hypothetical protein
LVFHGVRSAYYSRATFCCASTNYSCSADRPQKKTNVYIDQAKRAQSRIVKGSGAGDARDTDTCMVDHRDTSYLGLTCPLKPKAAFSATLNDRFAAADAPDNGLLAA